MEAVIAEKLRYISAQRREFLAVVDARVCSLNFFEKNWVFHTVLLFCTVSIILGVFGVIRKLTLFSFHPLCMTIGSSVLLAEGIASYRNHSLLEAFSPIMQHTKKMKVRAIHQAAQITGTLFLVLGVGFIIVHKQEMQHSIMPRSIHSIVAIITLLLIVVQVISGQEKFNHYLNQVEHNVISSQVKIKKWHGDLGLLIWDLLCLTMFLGLIAFLPWSFTSLILVCMPWLVWMVGVLQVHGRFIRGEVFRELHEEFERSQLSPSNHGNNSTGVGASGSKHHRNHATGHSTSHHSSQRVESDSASDSDLNKSSHGFDDSTRHPHGSTSTTSQPLTRPITTTQQSPARKSSKRRGSGLIRKAEDVDYDPEEDFLYRPEEEEDEEELDDEEDEENMQESSKFLGGSNSSKRFMV